MKIQTVVKSACAGMVIYVAMAACAASEKSIATRVDDDAATPGSTGTGDVGPSIVDVIQDAAHDVLAEVSDPVRDAKADPLPPEEASEPCDKSVISGPWKYLYAEHAYSGASIAELSSSVTALKLYASTATGTDIGPLSGYKHESVTLAFKPGVVAAICEQHPAGDTTAAITSITFVRRR